MLKGYSKLFNENALDIVVQSGVKTRNYFCVTLELENSTYRPYQKQNNQIKYINIASNHPPSIIKQLLISIESQLSSLSSAEESFKDSVTPYQEALDKLGYRSHYRPPQFAFCRCSFRSSLQNFDLDISKYR